MSWGALNNHRDRRSSDPLPDFLMDQNIGVMESGAVRTGIDDPIVTDRQYVAFRPDQPSRGYGVSYPKALTVQMSKKTIFFTMIFFTFSVLISFGTGYVIGNFNSVGASTIQIANQKSGPAYKKPIVPARKRNLTIAPAVPTKTIVGGSGQVSGALVTTERVESDISKTHTSNNNNKDSNESESGNDEAEAEAAAFDNKAED